MAKKAIRKPTSDLRDLLLKNKSKNTSYRLSKVALVDSVEAFFQKNESMISLALGVVVVLISAVLLFRYIKVWRDRTALPEAVSTEESAPVETAKLPESIELKEEEGKLVPSGLPATYTVQRGDSTWRIAKAFYGSGYNYVDIEKENGLVHDQHLEVGMKLTVPRTEVLDPTGMMQASSEPVMEKTEVPETYTIVKGDYLWKIAAAFYGDGYKWVDIYNANTDTVKDPDVIEVGMVLNLPKL